MVFLKKHTTFPPGCTTIFENAGRLCDYETFTTIQLYDYTTINRLRLSAVKKAIRLSGVIVYDYTTIRLKNAYNYVTKKGLRLYDYETLTTMRPITIKARKQLVLQVGPG